MPRTTHQGAALRLCELQKSAQLKSTTVSPPKRVFYAVLLSLYHLQVSLGIVVEGVSTTNIVVFAGRVVFFASLGAGTLFLFATTSGVNLAIMSSVPAKSRYSARGGS